jgi:hypothetical protein
MFLRLPLSHDRLLKVSALFVLMGLILPASLRTVSSQTDAEMVRAIELRSEKPLPSIQGFSDLTNQQTYSDLSAFLNDRVAYRALVARWRNNLRYYWLGETRFNMVDVAPGGWLFFTHSYGFIDDWKPDWVTRSLKTFQDFLIWSKTQRANFYVIIAPDKESVYPEKLPQLGRLVIQTFAPAIDKFNNRYRKISQQDPRVIDYFSTLLEQKEVGGPLLYNPVGTHYTTHGAMLMVKDIVTAIDPKIWDQRDIVRNGNDFNNELIVMLNVDANPLLQNHAISPKYEVRRPCITSKVIYDNQTYTSYVAARGQMKNFIYDSIQFLSRTSDSKRCPVISGKTLIIGDSFIKGYLETGLSQYFQNVTFVHRTYYSNTELQNAMKNYDRVLLETVERDAPTVFNNLLSFSKGKN